MNDHPDYYEEVLQLRMRCKSYKKESVHYESRCSSAWREVKTRNNRIKQLEIEVVQEQERLSCARRTIKMLREEKEELQDKIKEMIEAWSDHAINKGS